MKSTRRDNICIFHALPQWPVGPARQCKLVCSSIRGQAFGARKSTFSVIVANLWCLIEFCCNLADFDNGSQDLARVALILVSVDFSLKRDNSLLYFELSFKLILCSKYCNSKTFKCVQSTQSNIVRSFYSPLRALKTTMVTSEEDFPSLIHVFGVLQVRGTGWQHPYKLHSNTFIIISTTASDTSS